MTTKPSAAPWADEPYKLIPTPDTYRDVNEHIAVKCASGMAHSHNCLLRGLNAIVQQTPHVPSQGREGYVDQDVRDLMQYVESWTMTVDHHHETEETVMFPMLEKLAGEPGLIAGPVDQHAVFHDGLLQLQKYAAETKKDPKVYSWKGMKAIIDDFAPALIKHLNEEIDVILALDRLDENLLKETWEAAHEKAKSGGGIRMLYGLFPLVLGTCDKTYESGNSFPRIPWFMMYAIIWWFNWRHRGAWRFNPCDLWGRPVPLQFASKEKK